MSDWTKRAFWEDRFLEGSTPWELGEPSRTAFEALKRAEAPAGGTVIVPGCGRGEDALQLAREGYEVSAVDWAETAVNEVRVRARREELPMEALCSSAWEIPGTWESTFDVWFEHTFFCAIDPSERERYVEQVLRMLKEDGQLVGAFFVTKDPNQRSLQPDNDGPPFTATEEELRRLFEPHFEIVRLEPADMAHPDRRPFEWVGHFRRKRRQDV